MQAGMTKSFRVEAPIERVWEFMSDMEKVIGCLPGAEYGEALGDNRHAFTVTIKVGPIKSSYKGEVTIEERDASRHRILIKGKGQDKKGKGGATMELTGQLKADGRNATEVHGDSSLTISGLLAQFGSRMIQDVSDQLFEQFTEALRTQLEGPADDGAKVGVGEGMAAVRGGSLAAAALKGAVRRTVSATKGKLRRGSSASDGSPPDAVKNGG